MYKVLLVDDEILIRERISKKIPWEELGYELVGTCENGREAIAFIDREPVSLILTDICMPYVDGLELAKYVYENAKNTKVAIITGYEEFEYAKKALEYHVFSYILKPVTSAELTENLMEIHKTLEDERNNQQVRIRYEDSYPLLENQFLLQLAQGKVPEEAIGEKLREFKINFRGDSYCAAIFFPREPVSRMDLEQMTEFTRAKYPEDVLAFQGNDGTMIAYIKRCRSDDPDHNMARLCQMMVQDISSRLGIEVFCLMGIAVMNLNGLSLSYEKALGMKEYLYLEKETHVYEWDQYQKCRFQPDAGFEKNDREKRLVLAVQSNLKEEIRREVSSIRDECSEKWLSRTKVVIFCQSLILAVMNSLERLNMEDADLFLKGQELLSGLYGCSYISEMEEKLLDFFDSAADIMNRNRSSYGEERAAMALNYISEHYSECSLSLQEVCSKLAISVSYFSSAFKNYTGMTFVEALTKARMEAAKELLKNTTMKTYEIAERCGYSDSNYFSSIFKKTVGNTPREYAKSVTVQKGKND
jgi:two-component system response regulator YesN